MMAEISLSAAEVISAEAIQEAIDALASMGGTVELPAMDLTLDRGIELRSGVSLVGQGAETVLRAAPAHVYPLAGYHNYGMLDAPLQYTDGLKPGMTVALRDERLGGFYETFARLTWVDEHWVGLDTGLHSDYQAEDNPYLATAFPLIFGRNVTRVAVRQMVLDGQRDQQPVGIGSCRGAAIYFIGCRHFEVSDVQERNFLGEGIGFQLSAQGIISHCTVAHNSGNGFHPGAGSTSVLFEHCSSHDNDRAGFFFCVRANYITVRGSRFERNVACGVSVGTRDCNNQIHECQMVDNAGPGLLFRADERPVEAHSVHVARCTLENNASQSGKGQLAVMGVTHDISLTSNTIRGGQVTHKPGIYLAPTSSRIWLAANDVYGCFPAIVAPEGVRARRPLVFACGQEDAHQVHYGHLPAPVDEVEIF